ncbi:hypothetical protein V5O48_000901 [Marasmius crinis-equi]|uniref:Uncharacterized protein n=1 Tax=Marasmius crinis-equi TaxID=585013 RepID=A0ABR3FZW7_9AGAR
MKRTLDDAYHEERLSVVDSLGQATQGLLNLQSFEKASRYKALFGEKEQGELLDSEDTFSDILNALPEEQVPPLPLGNVDDVESDDATEKASERREKEEFLRVRKNLLQYRETHRSVAAMASIGPPLSKYLETAFNYVGSQRSALGALIEPHSLSIDELFQRTDTRISDLVERCEALRTKCQDEVRTPRSPEAEAGPSPMDISSDLGESRHSCASREEQDSQMMNASAMNVNQSRELSTLDEILKATAAEFNSTLERCHEEDETKLESVEAVAKECRKSYEATVHGIIRQHKDLSDFQAVREGLLQRMKEKEEKLLTRCLNNMKLAADTHGVAMDTLEEF